MNPLLETLELEIQNISQEIPYISCGGCGIFALSLSEMLSSLGLKPEIKMIYRRKEKSRHVNKFLKKNKTLNESVDMTDFFISSWTHFMVELDGLLFDDGGAFKCITDSENIADCFISKEPVPHHILREACSDDYSGRWNSTFDREEHREELENRIEELGKNLSKYLEK